MNPEPGDSTMLTYFAVVGVKFIGRESVRDECDPNIHLDLLSTTAPPAELILSPVASVDLIERLTHEMGKRFRRHDIHDALHRRDPLPLRTEKAAR